MKNMMREYLGNDYSDNHLRNFCLYWIKALECKASYPEADEWRRENDLDCLYMDGDLRADTLMSAWTPIKWVADLLNRDIGIVFYKTRRNGRDPLHDLRLLAEETDTYLPPENELVGLLKRFLELAELRCNFILLPERAMNPERYQCMIGDEMVWLCDEVPATLAHLFDRSSLGKHFTDEDHVVSWVKREHLEMGFEDGRIDLPHVRPLIEGLPPRTPLWPSKKDEIAQALRYMIDFLETRLRVLTDIEEGRECEECREVPGTFCAEASASGQDRVAGSLGKAFEKVMNGERIENAARIDFLIKGDIPDSEIPHIDWHLERIRKWHDGDDGLILAWKCMKDGAMTGVCAASAVLHHKSRAATGTEKEKSVIMQDELTRPKEMFSDGLWEIYRLLRRTDRPYLWIDTAPGRNSRYRLYLVWDVSFGHGETDYGVGNMGIELPWSRPEWLDLRVTKEGSRAGGTTSFRIKTDAMLDSREEADSILRRNHMKLLEGTVLEEVRDDILCR